MNGKALTQYFTIQDFKLYVCGFSLDFIGVAYKRFVVSAFHLCGPWETWASQTKVPLV